MSDISTIWDVTRGDIAVDGSDLRTGDDLASAIVISLFTDRVLPEDEVPPDGSHDPRGWWADDGQRPIGSRLWTLERAKHTQETLARAKAYIEEALQWLIDDGVVQRFDITVLWNTQNRLEADIVAHRPDNTAQAGNYAWAWTAPN